MLRNLMIVISLMSLQVAAEEALQQKDYSIITDEQQVRLVFEQCSRMTPTFRTSYIQVTDAQVLEVEKLLPAALAKFAKGKPINLDDYYRQYVAFALLRREIIYVNAFHKDEIKKSTANWRSEAIIVCGGQEKYWGALYDDQSKMITEILFNTTAK